MIRNFNMYRTLPVGIVLHRSPGLTAWVKWNWKAAAVLPGAEDANWREMRTQGKVTEFHAATLPLELHGADTGAYLHELHAKDPSVYIVMRDEGGANPLEMVTITASPYEAQDYADTGEEIVEKVSMPASLLAWVQEFVDEFHSEETFIKRKRDKKRIDLVEDGIGDPRIGKPADIYASPAVQRRRLQ